MLTFNSWFYTVFFAGLLIIFYRVVKGKKQRLLQYARYEEASGTDLTNKTPDTGTYGEFLIFQKLEQLAGFNKILGNLYLPQEDGSTTEVDLLMICQRGIYVFESKNYSGWIFGNEKYKNWTQVFPNQEKHRFYNPIWQNNGHINALKEVIGIYDDGIYKSYIVFGQRCQLKDITITSPQTKVIKRDQLVKEIKRHMRRSKVCLSIEEVRLLYEELHQYTRVDDAIKEAHVHNLQKRWGSSST